MSMLKKTILNFLPPVIFSFIRKLWRKNIFKRGYATWADAVADSTGYDTDVIFQKQVHCAQAVRNGTAVYERDGQTFDRVGYTWHLLSGILYAATINPNLRVMDFGGGFGTTYLQNRKFLNFCDSVSWGIVEQSHISDFGRKNFETSELAFFSDLDSCVIENSPNTLVMGGVLQYLEHPSSQLRDLLRFNFDCIILDRVAFSNNSDTEIVVQKVSPKIYDAKIPLWFFRNPDKLISVIERLGDGYKLIENIFIGDVPDDGYHYRSFIFVSRAAYDLMKGASV